MKRQARRLKADLKEIVVSKWYEDEGFDAAEKAEFESADGKKKAALDDVDTASKIVLDEGG